MIALFCVLGLPGAEPPTAAHFHHVHLNSTDPQGAVRFFTGRFDCEPAKFAGREAVWAQKSWLLFNKVDQSPPWELTSAIWHIGWGAEDMPAAYKWQLDMGTRFFTPLTDISDLAHVPNFYYAYVESPDRALIELNTATHHRFGHLHLFSADPPVAAEWYRDHLGLPVRINREERFYKGLKVAPSAGMTADNVSILIFPLEHARQSYPEHWKGKTAIDPTRGRAIDHIAFSVDDLAATIKRLQGEGVHLTEDMRSETGAWMHAFIEGPDRIAIELVEGQAHKE